jgi:hypothetical protein
MTYTFDMMVACRRLTNSGRVRCGGLEWEWESELGVGDDCGWNSEPPPLAVREYGGGLHDTECLSYLVHFWTKLGKLHRHQWIASNCQHYNRTMSWPKVL